MVSLWTCFRYKKIILSLLIFIFLVAFIYTKILPKQAENKVTFVHEEHLSKRLAILVPFRDRFDELLVFVPQLSYFLTQQRIINFKFYILNQSARYRFNRGALANVGYLLARDNSDYIAIHDVDLIPLNQNLSYAFPKYGPYHLASPEYHPLYNYSKYFGGILLISNRHYELVNGMSNRYYGWGLEDDEFYTRIRSANLHIFRPNNLPTNTSNTFIHLHYKNRKRDTFKSPQQREISKFRDKMTGLSDIKYSIVGKHNLKIDNQYECDVFNIDIICDKEQTPWCIRSIVPSQTPTNVDTS